MSDLRAFKPRVQYDGSSWFAQVFADEAAHPYWFGVRITKLGATLAAHRIAWKLNRLEKRGLVQ